jgi:hypothetical protein
MLRKDHAPQSRCFHAYILLLFVLLVSTCKPQQEQQGSSQLNTQPDTTSRPATSSSATEQEPSTELPPEKHEIIDYAGIDDEARSAAQSYKPFTALSELASNFIWKKDSLLRSGSNRVFEEEEEKVYAAILAYQREIQSGKFPDDPAVALMELPRQVGEADSSFHQLPDPKASFFTNENFFFIGGAPFVQKIINYDTVTWQEKTFTDSDGNPEVRFQPDTENTRLFFKSVMHFRKPRIKVSFGGPVGYSNADPHEVKGIGSVIHHFEERIPVFFLTEKGLVPARLLYYDVPFTEQFRCYSDYPRIVFACNTLISANEILAVYIPYDGHNPAACSINRESKWLWTADLNGDAVPDVACATGTFDEMSEGQLEILWFVNINGQWKIIDYGSEPSCT